MKTHTLIHTMLDKKVAEVAETTCIFKNAQEPKYTYTFKHSWIYTHIEGKIRKRERQRDIHTQTHQHTHKRHKNRHINIHTNRKNTGTFTNTHP